jgi:MFS family permease
MRRPVKETVETGPDFPGIFENRSFMLLWSSQILTELAVAFLNFSLLLWVFDFSQSNSAVSWVVATVFLSSLLFSVFAGVVADQFSRRRIMMTANVLRALTIALFLVVPARLWWIVGVSFLVNSINQFFIPAEAATIPMLVDKKRLITANSMFVFLIYLSLIGGFVLAGPMIDLFGYKAVFALSSVLTLISTLFIVRLPPCRPQEKSSSASLSLLSWIRLSLAQIKEGMRFIVRSRHLSLAFLVLAGVNGLVGLVSSLAPGFVVEVLQVPVTSASYILMAPLGTGLVAGTLLVGRFGGQFAKRRLIAAGMLAGGVIFFLVGFLPFMSTFSTYKVLTLAHLARPVEQIVNLSGILSALAFFLGLTGVMVVIPSQTVLHTHTPDGVRGRIFGVFGVLVYGASAFPTLIGAHLADWFGVTSMIMVLGIVIAAGGVVGLKTRLVERFLNAPN